MSATPHLIVVEDDPEIRNLLDDYLVQNAMAVTAVQNGERLNAALRDGPRADLIILDIMLPGEDGLSICRRLRATSDVPILMLTARSDDIDRIVGLELGADDYLGKPFNPRELLARVRAILRRRAQPHGSAQGASPMAGALAGSSAVHTSERFRMGDLIIDCGARSVRRDHGETLNLTGAEFDLLVCFIARPGRVLSRDQLMDWTRGRQADVYDRTIDVQMSRLRKKVEHPDLPLFKTLRGQGYMLIAPVEAIDA
ncbi:MAG: response regulator [Pseudomonadota bacterium]